ncbi:MAG: SDR family NAD(P)-dependent oxidoreductase, partial [Paludibacteraceae bacterium]|nr:SDR family NAD(P)-dependent oxidoreductase [Paludibacteraceae bacterium]
GNGIAGAVEDTSDEETRFQFETNFFGVANTLRACLPVLRAQHSGRIMVTSSVAAIAPIPYQSLYSASKAALLLYIEALSMEVKQFGIQCSVCLPGDTKTGFTSARKFTRASQLADSAYQEVMSRAVGVMEHDEQNGMPASAVAKEVVRNLDRKQMRMRVIPGLSYKLLCLAMKLLPCSLKLWVIGKIYG